VVIRLYWAPRIGRIPLNRLRVTDVAAVFDHIDDLNDAVILGAAGEADDNSYCLPGSNRGQSLDPMV